MADFLSITNSKIENFFAEIGISKGLSPHSHEFWEDLWNGIRNKGIDPVEILDIYHPMSPEIASLYFMDEETGIKFLSADLDRFKMLIRTIETHEAFDSKPGRIIEIGGGPGIISMWLASRFKDSECIVYDISENALNLGRLLASRLNLNNIEFVKASYKDLAAMKSPRKADLILGLSALFLKIIPENTSEHFSADLDPFSFSSPAREMAADFVKACSNILSDKGTLYFSQGAFNDLGLLTFFSLLRKNRLGLDWQLTKTIGEGEGSEFSFKEMHIFAKPGLASIFKNAREDLRTFLFSGKRQQTPAQELISHANFETYISLLSEGTRIAEIITKKDNNTFEKFMIFCKAGLLGFFSTSSEGRRSGFTGAAADFKQAADRLKSAIDKYRQNKIEIISEYWNPEYEKLDSF